MTNIYISICARRVLNPIRNSGKLIQQYGMDKEKETENKAWANEKKKKKKKKESSGRNCSKVETLHDNPFTNLYSSLFVSQHAVCCALHLPSSLVQQILTPYGRRSHAAHSYPMPRASCCPTTPRKKRGTDKEPYTQLALTLLNSAQLPLHWWLVIA